MQDNVVDMRQWKRRRDEFAREGRSPLYVSHLTGKVTGSPNHKASENVDFGDRLQRIRASIERINKLLAEIKQASNESAREP